MRVAFFSTLDNAPWGGCEVLWTKSAIFFASKGFEVTCFVPKWQSDPKHILELKQHHISVVYYKTIQKNLLQKVQDRIYRKAGRRKSYFTELLKCKPAYIFFSQSHSYDLGHYPHHMLQQLSASKIPYSIICQNNTDYSYIPPARAREQMRGLFKHAHKVFFVSMRNMQTANLHLCDSFESFTTISNSLSITRSEIKQLPFPQSSNIQFASVANLKCSHKGQNILLHVFSQQKWKDRNWCLNLYGKGEDEQYLKQLAEFLGLQDRVQFHGHVQNLSEVWLKNHLLLLASFGEGLPLALQEAMLLGRAAVVTDVGGNAELIKEGETGFVSKGTTFSAFDEALENAWSRKHEWELMGKRANEYALEQLDLEPEDILYQHVWGYYHGQR